MAKGCMKRCLVSLIVREMKIKTTVRYHVRAVIMVTIRSLQIDLPRKWWRNKMERQLSSP